MSCGVGHRCSSDLTLLWLWRKLVATALIRSLAWEPPYAMGAALEKIKRPKKKKKSPNRWQIIAVERFLLTLGSGISSLFFLAASTACRSSWAKD